MTDMLLKIVIFFCGLTMTAFLIVATAVILISGWDIVADFIDSIKDRREKDESDQSE